MVTNDTDNKIDLIYEKFELLQKELSSIADEIDEATSKVDKRSDTLKQKVQSGQILACHYVFYLRELRNLGFVVIKIRDFNAQLNELVKTIDGVLRIRNYLQLSDTDKIKGLRKIATNSLNLRDELCNIGSELADNMLHFARRYLLNEDFKQEINASLASEEDKQDLMEWSLPWTRNIKEVERNFSDLLNESLATLQPPITQQPTVQLSC